MTRTVALSDPAYLALARLKKPGESFSQVVLDLVATRRPSVKDVSGSLADDGRYWKRFADERRKKRRRSTQRARLEGD